MFHPSHFTRLPRRTDQDMVLAGLELGTQRHFYTSRSATAN